MKPNGWNPTRRNRNIGTAKSGHGQDNRLVIPESWNDFRVFWERLRNPVQLELKGFTFLVEPCLDGFAHSVTVDDILRIIAFLPKAHVAAIRIIALRQPTKKQRVLGSVWGRLAYFAEFGPTSGPAVILEAQPLNDTLEFPKSLSPDAAEELDRLRQDGHDVRHDRQGRRWRIEMTPQSIRNTQLFRTFPHEIGHYVQYQRDVLLASNSSAIEESRLRELYFTKPQKEREDFAHRYAREFGERMIESGRIPFEKLGNRSRIQQLGLKPAWFGFDP